MLYNKPTMLIVDDLPEIRIPFVVIFKHLGFSVRDAADGFSALLEMRLQQPDILISDLAMPGMSGFELLSVVRRRYSKTLVIAMSDVCLETSVQQRVPADEFHAKLEGPKHLVDLVQQFVKRGLRYATRSCVPTWIAEEAQTVSGDGAIVVLCPECLRSTVTSLTTHNTSFHQAACLYCANLIPLALVPTMEHCLPLPCQQVPETASKSMLGSMIQ